MSAVASPITRRQVIRIAGAAGLLVLTPRALGGSTRAGIALADTACVLSPNLEIGPYFVDAKLNRSNILANHDGTEVQAGSPLDFTLHILDSTTCAPLAGAQIDVWQANAQGVYSDESVESTITKTWLRGYQVTDANGRVTFKTIFPGWYSGRTPHIHIMVRQFQTDGTTIKTEWTTQLLFTQTDIDTTLHRVAPYDQRPTIEPDTSNASDHVYSAMTTDVSSKQQESTVLKLTGSASAGYAATINLALAPGTVATGGSGGAGGGAPPSGKGPGSPPGSTTTTTIAAAYSSCRFTRSSSGARSATVKVSASDSVAVLARLMRNGKSVGQAQLAKRAKGARTLHVAIGSKVAGGSATLYLTFTNAAGKTKTVKRTVQIPTAAAS